MAINITFTWPLQHSYMAVNVYVRNVIIKVNFYPSAVLCHLASTHPLPTSIIVVLSAAADQKRDQRKQHENHLETNTGSHYREKPPQWDGERLAMRTI